MFLKKHKPLNNSLRNKITLSFLKFLKFKRLIISLKKKNGKNFKGRIVVRHKGGGKKFMYRIVDNLNFKYNYSYKLLGYDYCYYRTCILGLFESFNKIKKYKTLPDKFYKKDIKTTFFFKGYDLNLGDSIPLGWIPNNILIYNVESRPKSSSLFINSAGTYGKVVSHTNNYVKILLPSGKKKYFSKYSLASIGRVSNLFYKFQNYGKAGYLRNMNKRPNTKGKNMNSYDHPNGGKGLGGRPIKNFTGKIIK